MSTGPVSDAAAVSHGPPCAALPRCSDDGSDEARFDRSDDIWSAGTKDHTLCGGPSDAALLDGRVRFGVNVERNPRNRETILVVADSFCTDGGRNPEDSIPAMDSAADPATGSSNVGKGVRGSSSSSLSRTWPASWPRSMVTCRFFSAISRSRSRLSRSASMRLLSLAAWPSMSRKRSSSCCRIASSSSSCCFFSFAFANSRSASMALLARSDADLLVDTERLERVAVEGGRDRPDM